MYCEVVTRYLALFINLFSFATFSQYLKIMGEMFFAEKN